MKLSEMFHAVIVILFGFAAMAATLLNKRFVKYILTALTILAAILIIVCNNI